MPDQLFSRIAFFAAAWLAAAAVLASPSQGQEAAGPPRCRLPVLQEKAAWERLPKVEVGAAGPLPIWARALAGPLPRTTTALLELDHLYRTSDAYDPRLRALMRWEASRANRCTYSQRYAEADLVRTGYHRAELADLESKIAALPESDRAAIAFARKLTLAADSVTDEDIIELVAAFGEQQVVAMVLQMAYANFQDRLLLTLDAAVEQDGPLPPRAVRFAPPVAGESTAANRPALPTNQPRQQPQITLGADWTSISIEQLIRGMDQQRARPGRVRVPEWKDVHPRLPAGLYPADRPVRIKWSLVVLGHQPQLGAAWMKCLRTFAREANQDRVFEESLFWVITRSIDCFY